MARQPGFVPEKGGKVRMCIDLVSLNRVCSQDPFWQSRVGRGVGLATNYARMPFGLMNVGATFQRSARFTMEPCEPSAPREPPRRWEPPGL